MRVPPAVAVFLAIGLLAASQSGNIIRLADAHPVAICAWRLILASVLLAPLAGRRLIALTRLGGRELGLLVLAGAALTAHFITFIAAIQNSTVANVMVFFGINPVFTAVAAHLIFRERVTRWLLLSIGLGLAGVVVMGIADFQLRPEHTVGNALAVLCSALFTAYFMLGKRLRRTLDNRVYVPALYGVAALLALPLIPVLGLPLVAYDGTTWLAFGLMALVPTMLGHTSMNLALRYIDAGRISVLTLTEPILAGLVALWAWGEPLTWHSGAGYVLIVSSVVVLSRESWSSSAEDPTASA